VRPIHHLFTARCEGRAMVMIALKMVGNAAVPLAIALVAHFAG
jgi:hypothetical protein